MYDCCRLSGLEESGLIMQNPTTLRVMIEWNTKPGSKTDSVVHLNFLSFTKKLWPPISIYLHSGISCS